MITPRDAPHDQPSGESIDPKAALRRAIRAARRARLVEGGSTGREADAATLAEHGMAWLADHERRRGEPVRCVTAYEEMAAEPPIGVLVQALLARGVQVLVPITMADGVLRWRNAEPGRHDNPLAPRVDGADGADESSSSDGSRGSDGSWGSDVLARVDVALIPALALGARGVRLGQGGGYYDRVVPTLRASGRDVPVVGVVYAGEVGRDVPALAHDISVDAAMTPGGLRQVG
ncbi:5-formyltetrahydrofolate cyclo-ligase [soil metagenome]